MEVEVDLYSGRPNPRFELGPGPAAELVRRLAGLTPHAGSRRPHEGLGYRGLRIDMGQSDTSTGEIVVSGGVVLVRDRGGAPRLLEDRGRELERWLVDTGAPSLDPAVVTIVRQDLASS